MRDRARLLGFLLPAAALLVVLAWGGGAFDAGAETAPMAPVEDAPVTPESAPATVSQSGATAGGDAGAARFPAGGGGLRARIDPESGRLVRDPGPAPGESVAPELGDRRNTYGGDLVQEALPGGGFKVDLRGRFRSSVVATIDPESGAVEIDCVTEPAAGESADER